jgi:protein-tyrosine phosphatase
VCTGNICRSPLAEQLLRKELAGDPRFEIASAGLNAVVGAPMDTMAAEQLRAHGGDPHGLVGEQLDDIRVDAADLILTMTRGQRDHLVQRYPRAAQRTFTLAEFAALVPEAVQAAKHNSSTNTPNLPEPRFIVEHAAHSRFKVHLTDADDVPDPINGSVDLHERVADQISSATNSIAHELSAR